jgi:hypothetical protein
MNIPMEAVSAAKEAMREVTPPTGVSKADWLAEHGSFALIAGALEAAAPHMLQEAKAEAWSHGHHDGAVDQMLHIENGGAKTTPNPYILNNEGEK